MARAWAAVLRPLAARFDAMLFLRPDVRLSAPLVVRTACAQERVEGCNTFCQRTFSRVITASGLLACSAHAAAVACTRDHASDAVHLLSGSIAAVSAQVLHCPRGARDEAPLLLHETEMKWLGLLRGG